MSFFLEMKKQMFAKPELFFCHFKVVAVNFFVIAFRFFCENQHEEEYLRAVLRREA